MKKLVLLFMFLLPVGFLSSQVLFIDSNASEVEFEVKRFKIFEVEGTIKGMNGTIRFDSTNLENSSFLVCIETRTVDTGKEKRDEDLKSERFFDVENFPRICFSSTRFRKVDEGYVVEGILGIKNKENPISIPFTFKDNEFKGEFVVNRLDYEVGKDYSTFKAGEEIEIEIECKVKG